MEGSVGRQCCSRAESEMSEVGKVGDMGITMAVCCTSVKVCYRFEDRIVEIDEIRTAEVYKEHEFGVNGMLAEPKGVGCDILASDNKFLYVCKNRRNAFKSSLN